MDYSPSAVVLGITGVNSMETDIVAYTATYVLARVAILLLIGYSLFRLVRPARRPARVERRRAPGERRSNTVW